MRRLRVVVGKVVEDHARDLGELQVFSPDDEGDELLLKVAEKLREMGVQLQVVRLPCG